MACLKLENLLSKTPYRSQASLCIPSQLLSVVGDAHQLLNTVVSYYNVNDGEVQAASCSRC